ncbi:MAG: hypothetical protein RL011_2404 [Pseudomonadota bacterium]
MKAHLFAMIAVVAMTSACGGQNGLSGLTESEFAAEIGELGNILDGIQRSASFAKDLATVSSKAPQDFMSGLTRGMSDEAFVFKGVSFSGIKSKVAAKSKVLASFQAKLGRTYRTPAALFAAHGLDKKVDRSELADYFAVAKLGLSSLASGKAPTQQLDSMTIARALHVAAALSAATKASKAALALDDSGDEAPGFRGNFSTCASASTVAKEKSYICATDDISGSIGYMSGDRSQWIDGVSGKEFTACNGDSKFVKNGWGWNPDPNSPNGGVSCHVNVQGSDMPYYQKELDEICKAGSESAKTNQAFCESKPLTVEEGGETQPEPAPKPTAKKTTAKKPTTKKPTTKK